ncbi:MAG: hypothetical protein H6907_13820 [Hyphomicrobiales bacterium]|nr:hypothetical protein [Hyphomicrobiales bacterium]MCP5372800.1 hypothetical protein [Hyphomicrobiales bacterium]
MPARTLAAVRRIAGALALLPFLSALALADADLVVPGFEILTVPGTGQGLTYLRKLEQAQNTALDSGHTKASNACRAQFGTVKTGYLPAFKEAYRGSCSCKTNSKGEHRCTCDVAIKCLRRNLSADDRDRLTILELYRKNHWWSTSKLISLVGKLKLDPTNAAMVSFVASVRGMEQRYKLFRKHLGDVTNPKVQHIYIDQMEVLQAEIDAVLSSDQAQQMLGKKR